MDTQPLSSPLPNLDCPLCGAPNLCASAQSGSFDEPCWCQTTTFPPELLARVPPEKRRLACICAACVRAHARQSGPA